jgi:amidase/nitrilase
MGLDSENVRVAVAQVSPEFMDREATLDKACKTIEVAGKKGAKLIVFPETFVPGYPYWRGAVGLKWANLMLDYQKNAVRVPEDVESVCESARDAGMALIVGINEMDKNPGSLTLYNTLIFIDSDGRILGKHRKLMPTHRERMIWGMGDGTDIQTYRTDAGVVGGLICYENHMTPIKTLLAVQGEEIHAAVWPGYWVAEKHTANKRRFDPSRDALHLCDIDCAIREYAFETQTFVLSANMFIPPDVLPEGSFDIAAGGSAIVNPSGLYLVEPVFEERVIFSELDAEERLATKAYFDCVGHYSRWDVVQLHFKARRREPPHRVCRNRSIIQENRRTR